jgi:hypothetical protein
MDFNLLEEDIVHDIISQCSVISILKLYNVNRNFISKEHLEKNNPIVGKMWVYNNSLERKLIPTPGYINDYAIFEISYILSKLA